MSPLDPWAGAGQIAQAVASGQVSAASVVEAALARIGRDDKRLNAFTCVVADRARARAAALDDARARGESLGSLAGVPFAVKNLFDIAGVVTRAGAALNETHPPATADAALVARLEAAGAILVGALNMGEYAYDFTGENAHDGVCRNPHDLARMAGGSSSGSGAAVAGGLVPLALGSDTNGSIRVPSSFCGIFGLKPTYGRLSRTGSFPFVASLDHLGPFARSVSDLAMSYDALLGLDSADPAQAKRPADPVSGLLGQGAGGLRIAVADGYFRTGAAAECLAAVDRAADALGTSRRIDLPDAGLARAAGYLITATEAGTLHLPRLRASADGFDPDTRDRLLAGAMLPAPLVQQAQKFRRHWQDMMREIFTQVDVILAPATPCTAPLIGQKTIEIAGTTLPLRPNIGIYTQPISFIGLPVALAPVWTETGLPAGVQIIAAPWHEDRALRVALALEEAGIAACREAVF